MIRFLPTGCISCLNGGKSERSCENHRRRTFKLAAEQDLDEMDFIAACAATGA